jgi:hypothetical protein
MQLMSDAITVLGSRHGLFIEPCNRKAHLVRFDYHPGTPLEIMAGITVNGRKRVLPLTSQETCFEFLDQDASPTSIKLTGIEPNTQIKLELTVTVPFRPRDGAFSTIPVLDIELKIAQLGGNFRWVPGEEITTDIDVFFSINDESFVFEEGSDDELRWRFDCLKSIGMELRAEAIDEERKLSQTDALVVHQGRIKDRGIETTIGADQISDAAVIHASWCTWSSPIMEVFEKPAPFKYTENFSSLDEVCQWTREHATAIQENRDKVDAIFASNNLDRAVNGLMAHTLHSWLANTWWTVPEEGDWFTVWEGSCYYNSTIDVEYTQSPFYLSVWPELLGYELDMWPKFTLDGKEILGEAGENTLVFQHDVGPAAICNATAYDHHMPVEENTNYVLMSYVYWKRTGDFSRVERNAEAIEKALEFVLRCDTTGNGVPDQGAANTIDDASPAVQFGKEQIYLAVKAVAAFETGAEMLEAAGQTARCADFLAQSGKIKATIDEKGWKEDHFVTLLDPSAEGVVNAWTGEPLAVEHIPGWDAAHIYTANGLALLDMVGKDVGLNEEKIQSDLYTAAQRCLGKFGCFHSDYTPSAEFQYQAEGDMSNPPQIGWISMNMLRDISAFYRGVDLRHLASRYWDFQVLTNTQGPHLFFETFNGNNLMCYPRGIAVFGYFDALAGLTIDMTEGQITLNPLSDQLEVPVLLLADWEQGLVPTIRDNEIQEPEGLAIVDHDPEEEESA